MGWFKNTEHHTVTANIFVPTWGWDGSILKKQLKLSKGDFRPHLGMGWFDFYNVTFVKDSGFSSPLGDGLVLKNEKNKCKNLKIFVPEWGWVGSSQKSEQQKAM